MVLVQTAVVSILDLHAADIPLHPSPSMLVLQMASLAFKDQTLILINLKETYSMQIKIVFKMKTNTLTFFQ